jgi:phospholipase C
MGDPVAARGWTATQGGLSIMLTRRDLLRTTAAIGAASMFGPGLRDAEAKRLRGGSILDLPAADSPIDTVVVLMMENRSFDHYMGWLGSDETYLDEGRRRWGSRFAVEASTEETYRRPDGTVVPTYPLLAAGLSNPWRGCGHPDPDHGWDGGRVQRDHGFLAEGQHSDEFALGWYGPDDLAFYAAVSRRFTVFDRYHCSVLGPTYPNREYLHSGQSGGLKRNFFPQEVGYPQGFTWPTVWDRMTVAGVPARYYYSDLPVTALWGARLTPISSPIANYFEDAAQGTLPNVVFLDPAFIGANQTDEHPLADVRDGQRLVQSLVKAFVESPQWHRGVFFITYDEWGGFYDHVSPPRVRDDRANNRDDENDFAQTGFRVPTRMLSPYARQNFVDHRLYEHGSILRFLEWRFLGAPPEGKGGRNAAWYLTTRDRYANNIGWSLKPDDPDPEFDAVGADPGSSGVCADEAVATLGTRSAAPHVSDFERGLEDGFFERFGYTIGNGSPVR